MVLLRLIIKIIIMWLMVKNEKKLFLYQILAVIISVILIQIIVQFLQNNPNPSPTCIYEMLLWGFVPQLYLPGVSSAEARQTKQSE